MSWKSSSYKNGVPVFEVTKEEFYNYSGQPFKSKQFSNFNIYKYLEEGNRKFYIKYVDPFNNKTEIKFVK